MALASARPGCRLGRMNRVGVTRWTWPAGVVAAGILAGCASTPAPASAPEQPVPPRTAQQTQPLALAPEMAAPAVVQDVAGHYELELVGDGELGGQRLDLELRREPDTFSAACRAGLWDLEGSAEGGEREPLAVSLMGLSDQDEEPVAMRLVAESMGAPSGDIEGTAIVEHGGVATTLHFVARRRPDVEAQREQCGDLVYQHVTHYQGPAKIEEITTRRFEGCVEQVDEKQ